MSLLAHISEKPLKKIIKLNTCYYSVVVASITKY